MSLMKTLSLIAFACVNVAIVEGGLCSVNDCCPAADDTSSGCPSDYRCQCKVEEEDVVRQCFGTRCEPVCIPGITLPCCRCSLKKMFRRCVGRDQDGCGDIGCNSCGQRNGGLLTKMCSKLTCSRVRCVNTYEKKDKVCGRKCVCKWTAKRRGDYDPGVSCNNGSLCDPGGCDSVSDGQ